MCKIKRWAKWSLLSAWVTILLAGCTASDRLEFSKEIISTSANYWWARKMVDLDGDGYKEIVLTDNNASGGWLGYLQRTGEGEWEKHIISDSSQIGGTFAGGDIEASDFDRDGDTDILGFVHDGEWDNESAKTEIYLFENPSWKSQLIGEAPGFIKDVEVADFNLDGDPGFAVITYSEHSFQLFAQHTVGWKEVARFSIPNLHEGMAVGDIDGDKFPEVVTNGYWLKSPGKDFSGKWTRNSIDDKWHNQEGDWSRNATKQFCRDIDEDGRAEVFISHSERKGYPVAWYDFEGNSWEEHVIDTLEASHTLQVFDFDSDGDFDLLAGENRDRWDDPGDPVKLYLNQGDNTFQEQLLTTEGIYNGLAGDMDSDGDIDILRLPGHASDTLEVWINEFGYW